MTERMTTEQELALMDELEKERTPEEKLEHAVEDHLNMSDMLLQAVLDVAERGREEMEAGVSDLGGRFNVIIDLLELYRKRHSDFIAELYLAKKKAA